MSQLTPEEFVDYAQHVDAALKVASTRLGAYEAQEKAASDMIPQVVDALINDGFARPNEGKALATKLAGHGGALAVLQSVLDMRREDAPTSLGSPHGKVASTTRQPDAWERFGERALSWRQS